MKTGIIACVLAASIAAASGMEVKIGDKSYSPATDLTASLATSEKACEFKALLDADTATMWTDLKSTYEGSVLQTMAKSNDGNDWEAGNIDAEILNAIGNLDGYKAMPGDSKGARMEGAQKFALDHIAVKQVMKYVYLALDGPDKDDAAKVQVLWDHAFASYFGKDLKCAVYARANKRGKNYGTKNADGIANANTDVLDAFIAGTAGIAAKTDAFQAAAEKVMANVETVYIQAALRYLYLLDVDVTDDKGTSDHQGEGRAFWKVVEPLYSDHKTDAAFKAINVAYDLATKPAGTTRYCVGEPFLFGHAPAGVTKAMLGVFEYHDAWVCPAGTKKDAPAADKKDDTKKVDAADASSASRFAMGMAVLLPVLAMVF